MTPRLASRVAGRFFSASDRTGRNEAFLLWYPLLLAFAGLLPVVFTTPTLVLVTLLIGAAISCSTLVALCSGRARLRISRVLGTGVMLGYSLGALPTALSSYTSRDPNSVLFGPEVQTYALAFCQIFSGVAILWTLGELFEPALRLPEISPLALQRLKRFVWVGTAMTAFALVHGDIGYMGADTVATQQGLSAFELIAGWSLAPLVGITAIVLAKAENPGRRLLYGAALAFQLIATAPTSRRSFFYSLLLAFTMYSHWKPSFSRSGWKLAAALLPSLALISVAWTAFLYLRIATYSYEEGQDIRLRDLVGKAWVLYQTLPSDSSPWTASDVQDRVDIIDYEISLLAATANHAPAYGGGALNELKWSVPSVFWPGKQFLTEEDYATRQFGISFPDQPNSVFTAATIDFGFWGGLFYPVLLSWMMVLTLRVCWRFFPAPTPYILTCSVLVACMQTEFELFGYFDVVRNVFTYAPGLILLFALPPFFQRMPRTFGLPQRRPLPGK